jgi:hypothetical protein
MFRKFALRDLIVLTVAFLGWRFFSGFSAGTGPLSDVAGFLGGAFVGIAGFVLHEWGHALAGMMAGGTVEAGASLNSPFLFRFPSQGNDLRQFLIMSFGGFAVTGVMIWLVYTQLPEPQLATRVARGAILFLTSLTVLLEFPLVFLGIFQGKVPAAVDVG